MNRQRLCLAAAITVLMPLGAASAAAETLAVFTKSAGNPIARATRAGADQVAKTNGLTVFHYIPTSADNPRQQINQITLIRLCVRNDNEPVELP